MIWFDWMPAISEPTMVPASNGSSPPYSKLRPLRGSRSRFTPPASMTLNPDARASEPIMRPPLNAMSGFHVAAVAMPEGSAVRSRLLGAAPCVATPTPASVCHCGGMPRRAIPGTYPAEPIRLPAGALKFFFQSASVANQPNTRLIFSSWVNCCTTSAARSSALSARFVQGRAGPAAGAAAGADKVKAAAQANRLARKRLDIGNPSRIVFFSNRLEVDTSARNQRMVALPQSPHLNRTRSLIMPATAHMLPADISNAVLAGRLLLDE